jgi:hypothetical protein
MTSTQHVRLSNVSLQKHAARVLPLTPATQQQATEITAQRQRQQRMVVAVQHIPGVVCALLANQTGSEKEVVQNVNNVQIPPPIEFGLP